MKIVRNDGKVTGYIEREFGTYDQNAFQSYIGGAYGIIYLNFALEDEGIREILKRYAMADGSDRSKILKQYQQYVERLICEKDFYVREPLKKKGLCSLEISQEKEETKGYILCLTADKKMKNTSAISGTSIYVSEQYFDKIKMVPPIFTRGFNNDPDGFFSLSERIPDFKFYALSKKGNHYVGTAISIDYDKCCYCFEEITLSSEDIVSLQLKNLSFLG